MALFGLSRAQTGIDISVAAGRPGGVPTHVVLAPNVRVLPGDLIARRSKQPPTIDPFAAFGRFRRALGNRLAK